MATVDPDHYLVGKFYKVHENYTHRWNRGTTNVPFSDSILEVLDFDAGGRTFGVQWKHPQVERWQQGRLAAADLNAIIHRHYPISPPEETPDAQLPVWLR